MRLANITKQPGEYKDWDIDYSGWLDLKEDSLDIIESKVECLTDPDDTSLTINSDENTVSTIKLWIGGGTDGYRYKVTLRVSTVVGRVDESEIIVRIKEY